MSVSVTDHRTPEESDLDPDHLSEILESVCRDLDLPGGHIDVSLVNDQDICVLNTTYRQKNTPTNVLSFPQYNWISPRKCAEIPLISESGSIFWGDVIISCETVKRDSMAANQSFFAELLRISIHGILHLFGFDHETDSSFESMADAEKCGMKHVSGRIHPNHHEEHQ